MDRAIKKRPPICKDREKSRFLISYAHSPFVLQNHLSADGKWICYFWKSHSFLRPNISAISWIDRTFVSFVNGKNILKTDLENQTKDETTKGDYIYQWFEIWDLRVELNWSWFHVLKYIPLQLRLCELRSALLAYDPQLDTSNIQQHSLFSAIYFK